MFITKSNNQIEQLIKFSNIIGFLLQKLGGKLQQFTEFDEANAVSQEIIDAIKPFIDDDKLSPQQIRQGSGDVVCAIILALSEAVIKKQEFKPVLYQNNDDLDQTKQITKTDDNSNIEDEEDISDNYMDNNITSQQIVNVQPTVKGEEEQFQVQDQLTDYQAFQLECQQALPQLQQQMYSIINDWRPNINKIINNHTKLLQSSKNIDQQLSIMTDTVSQQLEQLQQRQNALNTQISGFSNKLLENSHKHGELSKNYNELAKEIELLSDQLQEVTEKTKQIQQQLQIESQRINDNSSVNKADQAVKDLNLELEQLDLRIMMVQQKLFEDECEIK